MPKRPRKGYYVKGVFVASGSEADRKFRDELHDPNVPSRSAQKQASESLQQLGEELVGAPKALLAVLPLPDELEDAIVEARCITSFGARRRQMQLIGKLMRRLEDEAVEAIRVALRVEHGKAAKEVQLLHRAEQWRDALIDDDANLERWIEEFPGGDIQEMRSLIRQARKDAQKAKPGANERQGRAYRQIFSLVRSQLGSEQQVT